MDNNQYWSPKEVQRRFDANQAYLKQNREFYERNGRYPGLGEFAQAMAWLFGTVVVLGLLAFVFVN